MKKQQLRPIYFMICLTYTLLSLTTYGETIQLTLPTYEGPPTKEERTVKHQTPLKLTEEELQLQFTQILNDMLTYRNQCILKGDLEGLKKLYHTKSKLSLWAYESEATKLKYLTHWAQKQSIKFIDIRSTLHLRKVREREPDLFGVTCNVSTTFTYSYTDTPEVKNTFKLGTSHYIHLKKEGTDYTIMKEWYTDPFADSLDLENIKSDEMRDFICTHKAPEYKMDARIQSAVDYAHKYCGISDDPNFLFKYNKAYVNCNSRGGDCANFASQILYEGGKFKKRGAWNYSGNDGTKAWVNAQAFKDFMVNSGRGSYIARGSYKTIYKDAYQMRPGDFVAYEKKGRIVHISTVTGLDSKGYPLVTCHNTDRLLVPYDLGWSNKSITFHLIEMHY